MNTNTLIQKINNSHGIGELFGQKNWNKNYTLAVNQLHYDKNNDPAAVEALLRLNKMRSNFERGDKLQDDAGAMLSYKSGVCFQGGHLLLNRSYQNFKLLKSIESTIAPELHAFLPEKMIYNGDLKASWSSPAYSLSGRNIPERHVKWILGQLLIFAGYLAKAGYVHAGLHPESIWIIPKTKRIIITSFYHLTKRNAHLDTVSEKYKNWYSSETLDQGRATGEIDIAMIKRTVAYLLGEQNGLNINQHKRPQNPDLVEFLLSYHHNAHHCYQAYQSLLRKG